MDRFSKKLFTQRFRISLGRMFFYYLVIYCALLCGSSVITKTSLFSIRYLAIAALFLPFIFIYSMLFELAEKELFPKRLKGEEAKLAYLNRKGRYFHLFLASIISAIIFVISLIICIFLKYLPLSYYPIPLSLHFALAGFLFASKHKQLQIDRSRNKDSGENYSLFSINLFNISWISYMIVLIITQFLGLFSDENQDYIFASVFMIFILIGFLISVWIGHKIKPRKKFIFESPFVREPVLLLSILVLPFITGIYMSFTGNKVRLDLVDFLSLFSFRWISVLLMMCGIGLVLELMRYLGRYNESHQFRKIESESTSKATAKANLKYREAMQELKQEKTNGKIEEKEFNDREKNLRQKKESYIGDYINKEINRQFLKSVQNYMTIFIVVLCFAPLMYFFGEFEVALNKPMTFFVFSLIVLVLMLFKPFGQMGFEEKKDIDLGPIINWIVFRIKRRLQIRQEITRSRLLIAVKIVGFLILFAIIYYAYQNLQTNPIFILKDGSPIEENLTPFGISNPNAVKNPHSEIWIAISNSFLRFNNQQLFKNFIKARESNNYDKKQKFLSNSSTKSGVEIEGDPYDLFRALRFSESDWKKIERDKLLFQDNLITENANIGAVINEHKLGMHSNAKKDSALVLFILSGFITIVVGLVLSSFIVNGETSFSSLGILLGVTLQALIVGIIGWYFFQPFNVDRTVDKFSRFKFNFLTAIQYQNHSIFIGITYIIFAIGLLVVVSLDRYFRKASTLKSAYEKGE